MKALAERRNRIRTIYESAIFQTRTNDACVKAAPTPPKSSFTPPRTKLIDGDGKSVRPPNIADPSCWKFSQSFLVADTPSIRDAERRRRRTASNAVVGPGDFSMAKGKCGFDVVAIAQENYRRRSR